MKKNNISLRTEKYPAILKDVERMEQPNYFSIIPADVRYDKRLTPNAKLLYAEITALTNMNGQCFATNDYFAKLYDVSKISISKWISQLIEFGYIQSEITYKEGSKEIDKRYLTILKHPIKEKFNTPIKEKFKDNNTSINNNLTDINSKRPTIEQVIDYCKERKNNVDAQRWFDYYSSNGWKVGRNPMKDWKASVRNWERSSFKDDKQDEPTFIVESGKFYIDDTEKYSKGYSDLASQLTQEQRNKIGDWFFDKFYGKEVKLSFIRSVLKKVIEKGV